MVRNFSAHGAQLTSIGVRPLQSEFHGVSWIDHSRYAAGPPDVGSNMLKQEDNADAMHRDQSADFANPAQSAPQKDEDEKSDFDPLFDDEPDGDFVLASDLKPQALPNAMATTPVVPSQFNQLQQNRQSTVFRNAPGAPPPLDPVSYSAFSPDILMTAAIDGQVMLWDRRVHTPGYGVGSLPLGEKTRPWCVSVNNSNFGGTT